ncbi:MAG TPA: sigma-70 family RNA polymerase sigma factor [Planctomycetes bacterium]|nr:sigma-70 family RNA polymerase sigma factor [Planctomycetota bacterium]
MQVYNSERWAGDVQKLEKEEPVLQKPDLTLVERACNGDADSFTELCRRYYPAMVAIAHSVIGDRHLAEDAAQQTFAKAVRKLPQLKNKDKFAAWLAAICRNVALDLARSRGMHQTADDLSMIAAKTHKSDITDIVKEAINELSAPAREVIFLRYYDGMTYEQISAVLGISEQAINGRLRRAKKKMANYLRHSGFGEV